MYSDQGYLQSTHSINPLKLTGCDTGGLPAYMPEASKYQEHPFFNGFHKFESICFVQTTPDPDFDIYNPTNVKVFATFPPGLGLNITKACEDIKLRLSPNNEMNLGVCETEFNLTDQYKSMEGSVIVPDDNGHGQISFDLDQNGKVLFDVDYTIGLPVGEKEGIPFNTFLNMLRAYFVPIDSIPQYTAEQKLIEEVPFPFPTSENKSGDPGFFTIAVGTVTTIMVAGITFRYIGKQIVNIYRKIANRKKPVSEPELSAES